MLRTLSAPCAFFFMIDCTTINFFFFKVRQRTFEYLNKFYCMILYSRFTGNKYLPVSNDFWKNYWRKRNKGFENPN